AQLPRHDAYAETRGPDGRGESTSQRYRPARQPVRRGGRAAGDPFPGGFARRRNRGRSGESPSEPNRDPLRWRRDHRPGTNARDFFRPPQREGGLTMATLEQQRAEFALKKVDEVKGGKDKAKFKTQLLKLPARLHNNGLGQTVAFYLSAGKGKPEVIICG